MEPIDKLREILCTVPEIKEDLEYYSKPIQERHLRMYCEKKEIELYSPYWCIVVSVMDELDNTKDFQDQNDEVIESIVEFL